MCFFFFYFYDGGLAVSMKNNVERHFQTNHSYSEANYPLKCELRKKMKCNKKCLPSSQVLVDI
jgi:hypothetical protein